MGLEVSVTGQDRQEPIPIMMASINICNIDNHVCYSATARTEPLGKELINQNVTREQRIAIFLLKILTKNIEKYKQ